MQIGRELGDRFLVGEGLQCLAFLEQAPAKRYAMLKEPLAQTPYCGHFFSMEQLGQTALALGHLEEAESWLQSALERAVELGSSFEQGSELQELANVAKWRGDYDRAMDLLERSGDLFRQVGTTYWLVRVLWDKGELAWRRDQLEQATRYLEQCTALAREQGHPIEAAAQFVLALVACEQGAYDRAEALCAAALVDLPDDYNLCRCLACSALARVALSRGDGTRAVGLYRDALGHERLRQHRPRTIEAVGSLAWALAAAGQHEEAARLLAFAEREREEMGAVLPPVDRPHHERAVGAIREALEEGALAEAWAQGEALDFDEAMALALPDEGQSSAAGEAEAEG